MAKSDLNLNLEVISSHGNASERGMEPIRDSLCIVVPVTLLYCLIFVTGIIGNICTCLVIRRHRSMHTATNYYLFSLAISDLLLLLSGVPQEVYFIWSKYPYVFGEYFCIGRGLIAETSANATVLTITAFSAERFVAICYPFLAQAMSRLGRAIRIILLIWLVSILLAIPIGAQFGIVLRDGNEECVVVRELIRHSFQLSTLIFFFAPMSIILVLYLLIGLRLHRAALINGRGSGSGSGIVSTTTQRISSNGGAEYMGERARTRSTGSGQHVTLTRHYSGGSQLSRGRHNQNSTRRVLRMLVAVVICFFLCWAPFHAQRLLAVYVADAIEQDSPEGHRYREMYTIMTYVSGVLYYMSTCINPLLYNLMSVKFRTAFKAMIFGRSHEFVSSFRRERESQGLRPQPTSTSTTSTHRNSCASDLTPARQPMLLILEAKNET